jgi:hypothetical protein
MTALLRGIRYPALQNTRVSLYLLLVSVFTVFLNIATLILHWPRCYATGRNVAVPRPDKVNDCYQFMLSFRPH